MSIPMDYHLIFMVMSLLFFIIVIFLLFINDQTVETAAASMILAMLNIIFCIFVSYGFGMIGIISADSTGAVQHTLFSDMYFMGWLFLALAWINFMLMVYCGYLFWLKPWEEYIESGGEDVLLRNW